MSEKIVEELKTAKMSNGNEDNKTGESDVVYLQMPLSKKLLARKSPVFGEQFFGLLKNSQDGDFDYINMEDFSLQARLAFLAYVYGNSLYFANHPNECKLTLEVYLIADKYNMVELMASLQEAVTKLKIKETEIFISVDAVLKFVEFAPVEDLCREILRKCAETVNYKQIDILKLWAQFGDKNGNTLDALNEELNKIGTGRSEASFHFNAENFSQIEDKSTVFSPPCIIRNLPWVLGVHRNNDSVGCFVYCNKDKVKGSNWSCKAEVKIWVENQKEGTKHTKCLSRDFSPSSKGWGSHSFLKWNEVIDSENGYIKDDTVIFEVEIKAEAPEGVTLNSLKLSKEVPCKNCLYIPCLDGQPVKEPRGGWEGLKVARKSLSQQIVHGIKHEKQGKHTFPVKDKDFLCFLHLEEVSTTLLDEVLIYRCK